MFMHCCRLLRAESQRKAPFVAFTINFCAALVVTACKASVPGASGEVPVLVLEEVGALQTPGSFEVSSAALIDKGYVLLSRKGDAAAVVQGPPSDAAMLCTGSLRSPIAAARHDGQIVILDSSGAFHSVRLEREISCRRLDRGLQGTLVPRAAATTDGGWTVLARDADAIDWVVWLDWQGSELERARVSDDLRRRIDPDRAFWTGTETMVVLAELDWPFRRVGLARGGLVSLRQSDAEFQTALVNAGVNDEWIGLRVAALDSGFLQVLAEKGTERRAFVLYDLSGRLARLTLVDALVGILDSDADTRRMLVLRRTNQTEVVEYRWAWGDR